MNNHISTMLDNFTDASSKTDKQEEELTEVLSKISTYEGHMVK